MGNCTRCEFVAREGEVGAYIPERPIAAIIGNYPTKEDEALGKPFSDQFGKLLKLALKKYGLVEDDFIWLYALRCAPKGKQVKDIHLNACRNWVDQDLKKLRDLPERLYLVCGKEPMDSLLGEKDLSGGFISQRGQWVNYKGGQYMVTLPSKYVSDLSPLREDKPGQWWLIPGSAPWFWFQDVEKFARRVRALKESLGVTEDVFQE